MDLPSDNSSANSGTSTTPTNLTTPQQLTLSLVGPSVGLPSVSGVLTPPASTTVAAPLPVVQGADSAGSNGLLSRYIGVTAATAWMTD